MNREPRNSERDRMASIQFKTRIMLACLLLSTLLSAGETPCTKTTKQYTTSGNFEPADFAANGATGGLGIGKTIYADPGGRIDTENIVFPKTQPLLADYLGEGAGANHLFGFFFLDVDTSGNGIPNFFMIGPNDDCDGDGLANSVDDDDDGDGIPDSEDKAGYSGPNGWAPSLSESVPASVFRNGENAANAGKHPGDYWQWVPNATFTYKDSKGRTYNNTFVHPGAYLYVDRYDYNGSSNSDAIPDAFQVKRGVNKIPAFTLDKNWETVAANGSTKAPGLLGMWDKNWVGSTIFYLADDDDDTSVSGQYNNYVPYKSGSLLYPDTGRRNAQPDYNLYGTTDPTSPLIPELVKTTDPEGQDYWRYRWYQSDISGGRELVFFMVVFYGSGGQSLNAYYSKAGFNPDPVGTPNPGSGANSSGDNFGVRVPADAKGPLTPNNWFPRFQNDSDHDLVAACAFGLGIKWSDIATNPKDGTAPVAFDTQNQVWVDTYNNYDPQRRIIAYRALGDWLNTAAPAEDRIRGRYDIDLDAERESAIIRAIDGRMNHLMVGSPTANENAWLLGWEDLYGGGDRDYEDIVWYITREASGSLESNNVASDLEPFEDVSITSASFEFVDNFTDSRFVDGIPRATYINYFYKLASEGEWIPLIGSEFQRDPDVFGAGGTTVSGGKVTRKVTIQVPPSNAGNRKLFWKVEMSTGDPNFKPELFEAKVGYEALAHDFYYESAVLPSSNIDYYGSYETPSISWLDKSANRGHFYALKKFEHGNPPIAINVTPGQNPEKIGTYDPLPEPWLWDAGLSLYNQVTDSESNRNIYTWLGTGSSLSRYPFTISTTLDPLVQDALNLDDPNDVGSKVIDGILANNFHDTTISTLQVPEASTWLAAWVHGYNGAVLADGTVTPFSKKEWIMAGVKRSSSAVLRAPGVPYWFSGRGMEPDTSDYESPIHDSYVKFAVSQRDIPTRIVFGSESGMVHAVDAGNWRAETLNDDDIPFDGHFAEDTNFTGGVHDFSIGTGEEVWSIIPGNLLDDLKFNITGLDPNGTRAVVDSTGVANIIYHDEKWHRIIVFSQGESAGIDDGRTGSYLWAIDVTDVNDPVPLWEYSQANFQDMINPIGLAWFDLSPSPTWLVSTTSGGRGVTGLRPSMVFLDAYTGVKIDEYDFGSGSGESATGTPALLDLDQDGLVDFAYAGTSDGRIAAYNLKNQKAVTYQIPGARFFLSPNIQKVGENTVRLVFVDGDSPLLQDEDGTDSVIYILDHKITDFENGDFGYITTLDSFTLPKDHKVFSRPRLVGSSLVLGTTTGDTINLCDFDPENPGNLYIFRNIAEISKSTFDDDTFVDGFGSIKGPITVVGGVIRAHRFSVNSTSGDEGTPWQSDRPLGSRPGPRYFNTGRVLGLTGWFERFLDIE